MIIIYNNHDNGIILIMIMVKIMMVTLMVITII